MELRDIISEGKIDREGIENIEALIEENKKLRDAFSLNETIVSRPFYHSFVHYRNEGSMIKDQIRLRKIENIVRNQYFVKSKIIKILDNE